MNTAALGSVGLISALMITTGALAGTSLPTVIYSDIASSDTSLVPGLGGERFGTFSWESLNGSPNGQWWVLSTYIGSNFSTAEALIRGSGVDGSTGEVVARRGDDASALLPGETFNVFRLYADVNDAGVVGFGGNFDSDPSIDNYIATWDGSDYTLFAREGDSADVVFGSGTSWERLDTPQIVENGDAGFVTRDTIGLPLSEGDAYVIGTSILIQEGHTVPSGQLGGMMNAWEQVDSTDMQLSPDGSTYIAQGDLQGDEDFDDVVVVGGEVVVQQGAILPGQPAPVGLEVNYVGLTPKGTRWFVYGENAGDEPFGDTDWVYSNGEIIAETGAAITPDSSFAWAEDGFDNTFFMAVGNDVGDYVVGGLTDAPDAMQDAFLVLNGEQILVAENDPVDVDGNGVADDDRFIGFVHDNDAILTDEGTFMFLAGLRDGSGSSAGQALLSLRIPTACPADLTDDETINVFDLLELLGQWGACDDPNDCPADLTGDDTVNVFDLLDLLGQWGDC